MPIGTLVKDVGTTIYGNPIIWQIADINHAGYPANSVTLVSEKVIKVMPFDGLEASNSDAKRKSNGNNRYAVSNIRQWLNKEGYPWYVAQHTYDAPPSAANVQASISSPSGLNAYENTAGFMTGFSANMKQALLNTTLTVAKTTVDGGGSETVTDKVFLLSKEEVGFGPIGGVSEGTPLPLLVTNKLCGITADAVTNSETDAQAIVNASGGYYLYVLRSIRDQAYTEWAACVSYNGTSSQLQAYGNTLGLRPALNIPVTTKVSKTPGSDGAYILFA